MKSIEEIVEAIEGQDLISIASYFLKDPEVSTAEEKTPLWYEQTADAFQMVMSNKLTRSGTLADQDFAMIMILRDTYYDYKFVRDKVIEGGYELKGKFDLKEHHLLSRMQSLRRDFYKFLSAVGGTPISLKKK